MNSASNNMCSMQIPVNWGLQVSREYVQMKHNQVITVDCIFTGSVWETGSTFVTTRSSVSTITRSD